MKRLGSIAQMTFALSLISCSVMLALQLTLNLFPDPLQTTSYRRQLDANHLAVLSLVLLEKNDLAGLQRSFEHALQVDRSLRSLLVRRADGKVLLHTTARDTPRADTNEPMDPANQVVVPIHAADKLWGHLEVSHHPHTTSAWWNWIMQPLVIVLLTFLVAGSTLYWLYLRRALAQLDPSSVIPERIQAAYDMMSLSIALLDRQGRIVLANRACCALLQQSVADLIGKRLSSQPKLARGLPADANLHPWALVLKSGSPSSGHAVQLGAETHASRLIINAGPIVDTNGALCGCLVTIDDVSALHFANEKLARLVADLDASRQALEHGNRELHQALTTDALSGCLSRAAGLDRLTLALKSAANTGQALSCCMLDVDNFKAVNDSLGHAMGDRVIQEVGRALHSRLGANDFVLRYGGDEFIAVFPGSEAERASAIAEEMRVAVSRRCSAEIPELLGFDVTLSIGVAQWHPTDGNAQLLARADAGLYQAKLSGRNCVRRHDGMSLAPSPAADSASKSDVPQS